MSNRETKSRFDGDTPSTESTDADELSEIRLLIEEMRLQIAQLSQDLQESRRLNLRAADLLDMVYAHVLES